MTVKDGASVVVWFSCGAASAVAAWLTVRCYGHRCRVRVVNNYIKQEDPDNRRFLHDVQQWIGVPIEQAVNPDFPSGDCVEVWQRERYMSGVRGAPCTRLLKRRARQLWEDRNSCDFMVLGFTSEEQVRHDRFVKTERSNVLPILIEAGLTKADCFRIVADHAIRLPNMYRLGYPNANCVGCVKSSSATYWNHVRRVHPDVFAERASLSRDIGCRLVKHKGRRLYLDELLPEAKGRPMKSLGMPDCTLFCEE